MRAGLLLIALAGCAHAAAPAAKTGSDDSILLIRSAQADADVVIDGRVIGRVGMMRGGLALEPGHHQLELRRDDFFSAYLDLQLAPREHKTVALDLAPILP